MNKSDTRPGIAQLVFQWKWLEVQLGSGSLGATEEATLVSDLETLDLKIAATRCETAEDFDLKLERLASLLWPSDEPIPEDCLEHVMLASLIRDAAALTRCAFHLFHPRTFLFGFEEEIRIWIS